MDRAELAQVFGRADLFIDRGLHGTFAEESARVPLRVLIDPDPGYRQIQMATAIDAGAPPPAFDRYYTYGHNIGTPRSSAPTAGVDWNHLWHPVDTASITAPAPTPDRPLTTVMNWRSMPPVQLGWADVRDEGHPVPALRQPARAGPRSVRAGRRRRRPRRGRAAEGRMDRHRLR